MTLGVSLESLGGAKRILVIGSGGAGKSTLAAAIAERLRLPLVPLDALYWRSGWNSMPNDEWVERVRTIAASDEWVMDGNYGGTLDMRLARADAVVFLDLPRVVCAWRILKRAVRYYGRTRPGMPEGCPERMSWEFFTWVWEYPVSRRPRVLEALRGHPRAIVLSSRRAVREFMER